MVMHTDKAITHIQIANKQVLNVNKHVMVLSICIFSHSFRQEKYVIFNQYNSIYELNLAILTKLNTFANCQLSWLDTTSTSPKLTEQLLLNSQFLNTWPQEEKILQKVIINTKSLEHSSIWSDCEGARKYKIPNISNNLKGLRLINAKQRVNKLFSHF